MIVKWKTYPPRYPNVKIKAVLFVYIPIFGASSCSYKDSYIIFYDNTRLIVQNADK